MARVQSSTKIGEQRDVEHWRKRHTYYVDREVSINDNVYICLVDHISTTNFANDLAGGKWQLIGGGSSSVVSGTTNKVTKFTAPNAVGDSSITDDGIDVTFTEDLYMSSGKAFKAASGGGMLDLRVGADGIAFLSSDGGLYGQSYLGVDINRSYLVYQSNSIKVDANGISNEAGTTFDAQRSTVRQETQSYSISIVDTGLRAAITEVLLSKNNGTAAFTSIIGGGLPVIVSSSGTTANIGVTSSVAIGGSGITMKTNDTAYMTQAGFFNSGFEAIVKTATLTADTLITFPDSSGTVRLASTTWTAANMIPFTDAIGGTGFTESGVEIGNDGGGLPNNVGIGITPITAWRLYIKAESGAGRHPMSLEDSAGISTMRVYSTGGVTIGNGSITGARFEVFKGSWFNYEVVHNNITPVAWAETPSGYQGVGLRGIKNVTYGWILEFFAENFTAPSMYFRKDGNLNIAAGLAGDGRLQVQGSTADTTDYTIVAKDSLSADLFRLRNDGHAFMGAGTAAYTSIFNVGGDVEVTSVGSGYIVKSPDGTRWRITIDNTGTLTTALA